MIFLIARGVLNPIRLPSARKIHKGRPLDSCIWVHSVRCTCTVWGPQRAQTHVHRTCLCFSGVKWLTESDVLQRRPLVNPTRLYADSKDWCSTFHSSLIDVLLVPSTVQLSHVHVTRILARPITRILRRYSSTFIRWFDLSLCPWHLIG